MSIKESALSAITSISNSDFVRAVTSAGASRRITVSNLAKQIIEGYAGSTVAGSAQSVKAALDSLNSKIRATYSFSGTPDDNGFIVTNVPLSGWAPIGFVGTGFSRSGWTYDFVKNINISTTYWCIRIPSADTSSGEFAGSIIAIKL